jgi:TolB protein
MWPLFAAFLFLAGAASACAFERHESTGPPGIIAVASTQDFRTVFLLFPASRRVMTLRAPDVMGAAELSPDGARLAISGRKGIWVFGRRGRYTRLLPISASTATQSLGAVSWSGNGAKLVYTDGGGLFITSLSQVRPRRILRASNVYDPDWSPRGEVIAVVRESGQGNDGLIQTVRTDGRRLHTIARGRQPDISPDGTKIAFARRGEVYVVPIRGGQPRLIVTRGEHPEWSPDGRYLAFTRGVECGHAGCEGQVFVTPASGGSQRAVGPRIFDIGQLSWSR